MKTKRIAVIAIMASILLVPAIHAKVFADEPTLDTDGAEAVNLKAVFHFRDGVETVSTFKIFDTLNSGFDRKKALSFFLEGVIGWDRPLLYNAIGDFYQYGYNGQYQNAEFDVDIIFQRANDPLRELQYSDCRVKAYDVFTEAKAEKAFSGNTASNRFAYVDKVTFDCRGFAPQNPVYQKMIKAKETLATEEVRKNLNHEKETKKQTEATTAKYTIQGQLQQYFPTEITESMPSWVKQTAKWVETGKIIPQEYQNLIRYMVEKRTQ